MQTNSVSNEASEGRGDAAADSAAVPLFSENLCRATAEMQDFLYTEVVQPICDPQGGSRSTCCDKFRFGTHIFFVLANAPWCLAWQWRPPGAQPRLHWAIFCSGWLLNCSLAAICMHASSIGRWRSASKVVAAWGAMVGAIYAYYLPVASTNFANLQADANTKGGLAGFNADGNLLSWFKVPTARSIGIFPAMWVPALIASTLLLVTSLLYQWFSEPSPEWTCSAAANAAGCQAAHPNKTIVYTKTKHSCVAKVGLIDLNMLFSLIVTLFPASTALTFVVVHFLARTGLWAHQGAGVFVREPPIGFPC